MERDSLIRVCDAKIKLVRTEYGLSQDKMAMVIGLSKKTLVDIEKGRRSLGWTGSVALCAIFAGSETLAAALGKLPSEWIVALAFENAGDKAPDQAGLWWQTIRRNESYVIQQNMISQHFRLVSSQGKRVMSSFELEDLLEVFEKE